MEWIGYIMKNIKVRIKEWKILIKRLIKWKDKEIM